MLVKSLRELQRDSDSLISNAFAFSSKMRSQSVPDGTGTLSWPVFPSPAMSACLLSCAGHGISLISLSVMAKTMSQRPLGVAVLQTNN